MAMEKSFPFVFGRLTILILFWIGPNRGEQQLCNNMKPETGDVVNLNMNTTQIIQQNGMCSCKLTVDNHAEISMFSTISSPNCITNIELIDISVAYTFVCRNGKIDLPTTTPYINNHTTGDVFWLMVTVNIDHSLSGSIQIKSQQVQGGIADPKITVECYDPNMNSSSTTTTVATTTSSTVATTTSSTAATTKSVVSSDSPTTTIQTTSPPTTTKGQTTSPPVPQDISTTNGQAVTEPAPLHSQSSSFSPTSNPGGTGSTVQSSENTSPKVGQTEKTTSGNEKDFPVAAVAGGVAGGLVLILIIIIAVTCSRRKRQKKPQLLENGNGLETNNHGHSYLNQSFEDRESNMTENGLYQPSNYHYDNPTDKQNNINKDDNTIKPKTSPPVSSSLPAEMDGGIYASADDLPQNQASANPAKRSSDIPDHYASVNETPAFVPGDRPVESQEVAVSPSPYEDAIEPDTEVSPYEDAMEPHHEVSPSGDVYAVVNKVNQPKVSHEAVGDLASPEESEFQHDDEFDDEVNVVVDNAKQPNVSFETDDDPANLETIRLHSGDHGDDEEEAALNMMKAVSEEEEGSNDDNDLTGSDDHDEAPTIQSTDL